MKKIIISVFAVGTVAIICILAKIIFFNKNVPTGDQNGNFLTNYSSKDMLGNWNISISKQSSNLISKIIGTMNISSLGGEYFYGTITINESTTNNKSISGGTVPVEGNVYNDIVTIYFNYNEEYIKINYDAKFTPQISNNNIILNLKESNKENEYCIKIMKTEVNNNER